MTRTARILLPLPLLAFAVPAAAHSFHGAGMSFSAGVMHPFLGPDHLLAMVAVGMWATQIGGRALWAVPLAFVGAMLIGGMLGLTGLAPPAIEPMIAASVLALGLLVTFHCRTVVWHGALLMAFFAIFHGLAHGVELPPVSVAAIYVPGFALATASLHLAGIALARLLRTPAQLRLTGVPIALAGCLLLASTLA